jgi:hypothetical protein
MNDTPPTENSSKLRRSERGERVSVYLPVELAAALRVACASSRRSLSDAVTEAVGEWLASKEDSRR